MAKRPSRRQALREFGKPKLTPKQKIVAALSREPCRRMTAAEAAWRMTKDEVAREFRWARTLQATLDELAVFRDRGGLVH